MAVTIRLSRRGRRKQPFYRIIAADKERQRDGRFLEMLGTYNTLTDPPTIDLKQDRVKYWVTKGAQPSDTVYRLIDKTIPGFLQEIADGRHQKLLTRRAARKARMKGQEKTKSEAKLRRKSKGKGKEKAAKAA